MTDWCQNEHLSAVSCTVSLHSRSLQVMVLLCFWAFSIDFLLARN